MRHHRGYTLLEIMIVVAVILILGRAAITGAASILTTLRFNNAFNKILLLTQETRNRAVTNKSHNNTAIIQYGIIIDKVSNIVRFFADENGDGRTTAAEEIESFSLDPTQRITLVVDNTQTAVACADYATIFFTLPDARARLVCGPVVTPFSNSPFVSQLTIGVRNTAQVRKTFTLHEASGIPQL